MATLNKFNCFVQDLANKVHNLGAGGDALKLVLTNTAPVATNAVYADISGTELAGGNGYTTGGVAVTLTSCTQTGGVAKLILQPVLVTASGSVGPFRYAILLNSTPTSPLKPLIGWGDYGSSLTLAAGEVFTGQFDTVNGSITFQ